MKRTELEKMEQVKIHWEAINKIPLEANKLSKMETFVIQRYIKGESDMSELRDIFYKCALFNGRINQ